ncbi:MAG TPA: DUF4350 domain-containing protein, partial [Gemmataceae bacterium]|nr:DUF4350 domain-containing protein [Gemmataceae bacterium]
MKGPRRRPVAALAGLLALVALVGLSPRSPAKPGAVPFGQGTHAFRRILHDLQLEPLKTVADLDDPPHTLLIVLGDTDILDRVPGGLSGFLHAGGAVLLATDRATPWQHLQRDFGFGVTGASFRVVNNRLGNAYHNIPECPLLIGWGHGATPDLLGELPAHQGFRLRNVATNRPSCLAGEITEPGLSVLAGLPPGCAAEGAADRLERGLWLGRWFAVGGTVGPGRLLVLADHSIFINAMMLQPDTDNIDFTYNCLEWLTHGEEARTRVLFVEEGEVNSAFDIPLKQVEVPLPPEEALVPMANQVLTEVEKENVFNKLVLDVVPFKALVAVVVLGLTTLLAVYGLYRLIRSRHRVDLWAPLLERVLAKQKPAGSLLEQRHQAMLGQGNLWEPARALARAAFAEAGIDADADGEPVAHVAGSWWQRWALGRRALHLWRIA